VTRGVLLDMTRHFGVEMVSEGTAFNRAEIEAAASAQGIQIRSGDVVLFHTGWMQLLGTDNQRFISVQPGVGVEGAEYLADLGVVAIGADTPALEVIPFENPQRVFAVHQTLLAKEGVYILESMNTAELAADSVHEFMFVLGQPKFKGAVQTVINPIAIR
jgi:kynurenine formamidase